MSQDSVAGNGRVVAKVWTWLCSEATSLEFDWRSTVVVAWGAAALLIPEFHSERWYWSLLRRVGGKDAAGICSDLGLSPSLIWQVLIPVLLICVMRNGLGEFGLGVGNIRRGLRMCGLFYVLYLPCYTILLAAGSFRHYYLPVAEALRTWRDIWMEMALIFVMALRTEFFYRGFLLFGVKLVYGAWAGNLVQLVPYVLIHAGKPEIEAWGSLPVGLALGYLAARTNSVWYGVVLHWSLALLLNVGVLLVERW